MKNWVRNDSWLEMFSRKNSHRDGSMEKDNKCNRHKSSYSKPKTRFLKFTVKLIGDIGLFSLDALFIKLNIGNIRKQKCNGLVDDLVGDSGFIMSPTELISLIESALSKRLMALRAQFQVNRNQR